jgi:hypothetical protein
MAVGLAQVQIVGYSIKIEHFTTKFQLESGICQINENEATFLFEGNEDIVNLKF